VSVEPAPPSPTLSILLLCWNHAAFLEPCIASIAQQATDGVEIVFLDNASSDGSFELAKELFDRLGLTARMIRNTHPGSIAVNFNRLLGASRGELVAILSTDDWYEADYIAALLAVAASKPETGWFSCSGWLFFEDQQRSEPVDERQFITDRPVGEVILDGGEPHFFVGCAYRRLALEAVGGWDEGQLIEDRDLFLRLSQEFAHHPIAQRLVHYRQSSAAASANAAFMLKGWELFFTKHAELFGSRLPARRAETFRAYGALLTDQGDLGSAFAAIAQSLRLRPWSVIGWRTLAYLGRRWMRLNNE
jgi:GT2 family glycosyltransferase